MALYLQEVGTSSGYSTALDFVPLAAAMIVASLLSGRLVARLGPRLPMVAGCLMAGGGVIWTESVLLPSSGLATLGLPPCPGRARVRDGRRTSTALAAIPGRHSGMAASMANTSRELGAVAGVTVLGSIVNGQLTVNLLQRLTAIGIPKSFQQLVVTAVETGSIGGESKSYGKLGGEISKIVNEVTAAAYAAPPRPRPLASDRRAAAARLGSLGDGPHPRPRCSRSTRARGTEPVTLQGATVRLRAIPLPATSRLRLTPMCSEVDYSTPGPLTRASRVDPAVMSSIAGDPVAICLPLHSLVIQPGDAEALDLPPERLAENQIRPATRLVEALPDLEPGPLRAREPFRRVVGTCRHFALLGCAFLRYRAVPARVRCGFATYFQPGQALDHWVTEHWDSESGRWVRIDPEILGQAVLEHPEDQRQGEFLSGSEAWMAFRKGDIDAARFGVHGTANWGAGEIRGNAVKDLAALNKVEMLPWDQWGRMEDAYDGKTGADYDDLLDTVAAACAAGDMAAITALYARDDLRVPLELIA